MDNSILQGGIREIEEIKARVVELNNCRERKEELEAKEKQAQKSISKKENAITDEIKKVTRQRREHLEETFDKQLDSVRENLKKVEAEKEKKKKKGMMQRIDLETSDFRNEDEELRLSIKSVFDQEYISSIYNNRLFFALYLPRGLGDIGIIILTLALVFFVIPFGIYTLFFDGMGTLYLGLIYIAAILVFGGIYLYVGRTKYKHLDALKRVREMRNEIRESKKKQKKIKRKIEKDHDESHYDLGEFDREIEEYKKTIEELLEKKNAALLEFDQTTSEEIKRQITEANKEELNSLKEEYRKIYDEAKENMERLNQLSLTLSTEYESILGKEFLTVEKLDAMTKAIHEGKAENIGEAKDAIAQENRNMNT